MAKEQQAHTVSRWQFFVLCWKDAFHGAWGVLGAVSAVLGFVIPASVAIATRIPKDDRGSVSKFFTNPAVPDLVWFVPLVIFVAVLACRLFIVAPYNIYRDKPNAAQVNIVTDLRNKTLRLATEIDQFVTMRRATKPKVGFIPGDETGYLVALTTRERTAHSNETAQLYYARFAERVMDARESLLQLGIVDEELDRAYLNPPAEGDMAAVGQRLIVMADRLPVDSNAILPSHELAPDLAALHEANTRLSNEIAALKERSAVRSLSPQVGQAMTRALADGLAAFWRQFEPGTVPERFTMMIIAIGRERETLNYRADLASVFTAGGFDVDTNEWDAGPQQLEHFTGALTLLPAFNPKNQVRGIVADALRAGGLPFREAQFPIGPVFRVRSNTAVREEDIVAHLVIGQSAGIKKMPPADSRPEIMVEWIGKPDERNNRVVRISNGGLADAYNVEAVIWVHRLKYYAIRIDRIPRIGSHKDIEIALTIDNGPRQPLVSHDHAITFLRIATGRDSEGARKLKKLFDHSKAFERAMNFEPPPPDLRVIFDVTYADFGGGHYSTPHVLTYFDDTFTIGIALPTSADAASIDDPADDDLDDPAS